MLQGACGQLYDLQIHVKTNNDIIVFIFYFIYALLPELIVNHMFFFFGFFLNAHPKFLKKEVKRSHGYEWWPWFC